jgi:hypothetical protein
MSKIAGMNIFLHHFGTLIVYLISIISFYFLIYQIFPGFPTLTFAISLLFLIYPTDFIRSFWIITSYMSLAYIFFLNSIAQLIAFYRTSNWWLWIAAIILLTFSFGTYEAGVGLAILSSLILFGINKSRLNLKGLALLTPMIISISFSVWRWRQQILLGNTYGHPTETLTTSLPILLKKLLHGYMISIYQAWTKPIIVAFSLQDNNTSDAIVSLCIFLTVLLLAIALKLFFKHSRARNLGYEAVSELNLPSFKELFLVGTIGFCAIGAGYFPMILAMWASIDDFEFSRANTLPSVGASILLAVFLASIILFLKFKGRQANILIFSLLLPFVIIGLGSKNKIQQETVIGWRDQKLIWNQLFQLAPDIASNTQIVLIIKPYPLWHIGALPLMSGTEFFQYGINLFYGKSDLRGTFIYGAPSSLCIKEEGISTDDKCEKLAPFQNVLPLYFDPDTGVLNRIYTITFTNNGKILTSPPLCSNCVLPNPTTYNEMRWIVE